MCRYLRLFLFLVFRNSLWEAFFYVSLNNIIGPHSSDDDDDDDDGDGDDDDDDDDDDDNDNDIIRTKLITQNVTT